jgi:hypothetical protein
MRLDPMRPTSGVGEGLTTSSMAGMRDTVRIPQGTSLKEQTMIRVTAVSFASVLAVSRAGAVWAASAPFQAAVSQSHPILYYQLNEATGNAHNLGSLGPTFDASYMGTPRRAVATQGGDAGVEFDSADDFLESMSVSPTSLAGNPTFSAETVVFIPKNGTAQLWAPFLHWGTGGAGKEVYFSFSGNDSSRYFAGFYNGGLRTMQQVATGAWHHVVWVRSGVGTDQAGSMLYVDGAAVAVQSDPALCCNGATPNVVASPFRIGRARDLTRFFTGTLDEVALYDRALCSEEVARHFRATSQGVPPRRPSFPE